MKEKTPGLALILLSTFPIQTYALITGSTIIFILAGLLCILKSSYGLKKNKVDFLPMLACFFFGTFLLISLSNSDNLAKGVDYLVRLSPLYILPIIVFFLNKEKIQRREIFISKMTFISSTLILTLYILAKSIYVHYNQDIVFFNNIKIIAQENSIWDLHPTYISVYCVMAVFLLLDFEKDIDRFSKAKIILRGTLAYFCIFCILLSSRVGIISLLIGLIIYIPKKRFKFLLLSTLTILLFFSVKYIEPVKHQFLDIYNSDLSLPAEKFPSSVKVRYAIVHCSWESIKDNLFFGTGLGDFQQKLIGCYKTLDTDALSRHNFNTHNFYLFLWGSAGVFCLLSFVSLILLKLHYATRFALKSEIIFWGLILLVNLTESFLVRSYGITFFIYFLVIFSLSDESYGFSDYSNI